MLGELVPWPISKDMLSYPALMQSGGGDVPFTSSCSPLWHHWLAPDVFPQIFRPIRDSCRRERLKIFVGTAGSSVIASLDPAPYVQWEWGRQGHLHYAPCSTRKYHWYIADVTPSLAVNGGAFMMFRHWMSTVVSCSVHVSTICSVIIVAPHGFAFADC